MRFSGLLVRRRADLDSLEGLTPIIQQSYVVPMPVIDADAHVDETEDTWAYIDEAYKRHTPVTVMQDPASSGGTQPQGYNRYWCVDGRFLVRRIRDDERTETTVETRELLDVPARLRHMDELGIDVQVCYPTTFLFSWSAKGEIEHALRKSYNRWMAEKWKLSDNRLRWVCLLPMGDLDEAVKEMRFAREHGACGLMKKGLECGGKRAGDAYFFPLYQEAEALDMAVCIHTGTGDPALTDADATVLSLHNITAPVIDAFGSLIMAEVPAKFPKLRVGFVEAMSSWVPFALAELRARHERSRWMFSFDLTKNLLRESRFYVACQTVEDLPYIIRHCGEDNLIAGTDYSHADQSAEIRTLSELRTMGEDGIITGRQAEKILQDNPAAFYGLS